MALPSCKPCTQGANSLNDGIHMSYPVCPCKPLPKRPLGTPVQGPPTTGPPPTLSHMGWLRGESWWIWKARHNLGTYLPGLPIHARSQVRGRWLATARRPRHCRPTNPSTSGKGTPVTYHYYAVSIAGVRQTPKRGGGARGSDDGHTGPNSPGRAGDEQFGHI